VKRLLAAAAIAAIAATAAPAHATIIICNNLPVMVQCFDQSHPGTHCTVWVRGEGAIRPICIGNVNDVLGPIGA
jgi:hypothetical protein